MEPDVGRSEQLDERRRILDAAWRVLDRSGFQGLKVGSVVRAVPTSTRAFYRWFDDKDDLAADLVSEEYRRAGRRLEAEVRGALPGQAVDRWISGYFRSAVDPSLAARARLFASLRTAAASTSSRTTAALDEFLAPLRRAIEEGCRVGLFTSDDPAADAVAIHHLCAGTLIDVLRVDDELIGDVAASAAERITGFAARALRTRSGSS